MMLKVFMLFRGANIKNILNFKIDYPHYKEFKLEQTTDQQRPLLKQQIVL